MRAAQAKNIANICTVNISVLFVFFLPEPRLKGWTFIVSLLQLYSKLSLTNENLNNKWIEEEMKYYVIYF